jgi:hypothetical protein
LPVILFSWILTAVAMYFAKFSIGTAQ